MRMYHRLLSGKRGAARLGDRRARGGDSGARRRPLVRLHAPLRSRSAVNWMQVASDTTSRPTSGCTRLPVGVHVVSCRRLDALLADTRLLAGELDQLDVVLRVTAAPPFSVLFWEFFQTFVGPSFHPQKINRVNLPRNTRHLCVLTAYMYTIFMSNWTPLKSILDYFNVKSDTLLNKPNSFETKLNIFGIKTSFFHIKPEN